MDPLSSAAIEKIAVEKLLSLLFDKFSSGFGKAFKGLAERAGIDTAKPFESVSDLWYRGVDSQHIAVASKVKIRGVVSLYAPLVPAHPRSRPGRQVNTWIESRGATDAFSTKNFILWGDGVLVPPTSRSKRAVLGLFDKYGLVGFASMPLIIDLSRPKMREIYDDIHRQHPTSFEAEVIGRIVEFPYSLTTDFNMFPIEHLKDKKPRPDSDVLQAFDVPNFVIEVFELKIGKAHPVLYGTQWIGLTEKRMFPIYINLLDHQQHAQSIAELNKELTLKAQGVQAVFDVTPFNMRAGDFPPLNQYLEDTFRQQ